MINGFGAAGMNNMSMEAYKNLQIESEFYFKLKEAEKEAEINSTRYSVKEIAEKLYNRAKENIK